MASLKPRVILCRIRLLPTMISKMKWVWSALPLKWHQKDSPNHWFEMNQWRQRENLYVLMDPKTQPWWINDVSGSLAFFDESKISKTIDSILDIIRFVFRPDAIKLESRVIISFRLMIPFLGPKRYFAVRPYSMDHADKYSLSPSFSVIWYWD